MTNKHTFKADQTLDEMIEEDLLNKINMTNKHTFKADQTLDEMIEEDMGEI